MNKLKIYFTKDSSSSSASSYAARRKAKLIESSTLLGASLSAPFIFIKSLLWDLPLALARHIIFSFMLYLTFASLECAENTTLPASSAVLMMTLGIIGTIRTIIYETATTVVKLAKAPLHLVASVFNLSLFAVHKFFSLFASKSKPAFKPAPWKAPKVRFAKDVEVREYNPDSPLSETNDWSATTSFSEPAQ